MYNLVQIFLMFLSFLYTNMVNSMVKNQYIKDLIPNIRFCDTIFIYSNEFVENILNFTSNEE